MALRQSLRKSPWKRLLVRPQQIRFLSAEPATAAADAPAAAEWVPPPHPTKFRSPKVEELFFKMIAMPKEELQLVSKRTLLRIDFDVDEEMAQREAFLAQGGVAAMVGGDAGAPVEEEKVKTAFDLKLLGFDAKSKIKVIKEVRAIAGLGLKEAKEMVEGAPKVIIKGIKKEEAEELKEKLEAIGATIEIV
mmetsp:Transcript_21623/g.35748  ORF Transcript_21623/g.35748 Transcript_21623/m.35748 type:complete len:191 (-) Transcript_21623:102-674(-)